MKIKVQTLQGNFIDIDIEDDDTVLKVKEKLVERKPDLFALEDLKLILSDKVLADDKILMTEYSLKETNDSLVATSTKKARTMHRSLQLLKDKGLLNGHIKGQKRRTAANSPGSENNGDVRSLDAEEKKRRIEVGERANKNIGHYLDYLENFLKNDPRVDFKVKWISEEIDFVLAVCFEVCTNSGWSDKLMLKAVIVLGTIFSLKPDEIVKSPITARMLYDYLIFYQKEDVRKVQDHEHIFALGALRLLEVMERPTHRKRYLRKCLSLFFHFFSGHFPTAKTNDIVQVIFKVYNSSLRMHLIDACLSHKYGREFGDVLLRLANTGRDYAVKMICDIMYHPKGTKFFYTNDLSVFVDILLRDASEERPNVINCLRSYRYCFVLDVHKSAQIDDLLEKHRDIPFRLWWMAEDKLLDPEAYKQLFLSIESDAAKQN